MNHPSSAGLRELADFLDNCADEGIDVQPCTYVYFSRYGLNLGNDDAQRSIAAALAKRLNIPWHIPASVDSYTDAELKCNFSGVRADFHFKASLICEQVEVMRPVKVWKCGGVEVVKS